MSRIDSAPIDALMPPEHFATLSDRSDAHRHRPATRAIYDGFIANRTWGRKEMTRYLIVLAAAATAAGALISVDARTTEDAAPQMISKTDDGKPIILGRMVVTATALPEEK
ncbi:MAG TPA: hypothetical protein VF475_14355 [Sphingobium sp.]